jgi:RNA polymerase sigma-70 factor (ECF subfamily)
MRTEASAELVMRARQDRAAFGDLYRMYVHRVYAFCLTHSGGYHERAEDLTAQTFESALRMIAQYEYRGTPFSRWLLRIASNAIAEGARRDGRAILISDESPSARDVADIPDADPSRWVERWEQADRVQAHMATLSPDQKRVLELRFWEDLPLNEAGLRMGRSDVATRQLLRRAIVALRARMDEEETTGDDRLRAPRVDRWRPEQGAGTSVVRPRPAHAAQSARGGGPAG